MATAWTQDLPLSQPGQYYELIRAKPGQPLKGICLSPKQWGTAVHWFGGHSFPHQLKDCPACAVKRGSSRYAWVAAWNPHTRQIALFEMTPRCEQTCLEWIKAHGTLRATEITIKRGGTKINGPLKIEIKQSDYAINEIPADIDVRAALEAIWQPEGIIQPRALETVETEAGDPEPINDIVAKRERIGAATITPTEDAEKITLAEGGRIIKELAQLANPGFKKNGSHK